MDYLSTTSSVSRHYRTLVIFCILTFCGSVLLSAEPRLSIKCNDQTIELTREQLQQMDAIQIETSREKKGLTITENWTGIQVAQLTQLLGRPDFLSVILRSDDNYQVRLSREELEQSSAVIAWAKDGKTLNDGATRLIVPNMRAMYWIFNPSRIIFETEKSAIKPTALILLNSLEASLTYQEKLTPFEKDSGYRFKDIALTAFPDVRGNFRLIAQDGITHVLDYQTYLENAIVAENGDSLNLKSPDMPAGMWIKNLVYIQKDDLCIVNSGICKDMTEVLNLLSIDPETVSIKADNENKTVLDYNKNFADPQWSQSRKVFLWYKE